MTVGALAQGCDDIINTSITDVATGNTASHLSGYEKQFTYFLSFEGGQRADRRTLFKAPEDEHLLCFEAFSKATNVILSSNYMTYIKEQN